MTPNAEEIRGAIAQQAGEWFIAHQAGPLAAGDGAAFLAWLRASPIHVQEYLGVARIANGLAAAIGGRRSRWRPFSSRCGPVRTA